MGYEQVAWLVTGLAGVFMILLPRKWAIVPFFVVAFFIPLAERIVIFGLVFPMMRLLIIVGFARLWASNLAASSPVPQATGLNAIDKAMMLWMLSTVVTYSLLWQTTGAFVNRLGVAFDVLGIYFLVKGFVVDVEGVERVLRTFACIAVLVAVFMLIEQRTGRNGFFVFGGVPEFTEVREGRLRAQGAFMHPIMAGAFGAALFPLFFALAWGRRKALALCGMAAAIVITITSASSTPLMGLVTGIIGLCLWPFRKRMRLIRWGMLFALIVLQVVMKAPVWALIGRLDVVGGSTGYHRQFLMDQFFDRVSEWWLVGTRSTEEWGPTFLVMHDVTNEFIRIAVDGGLLTLILFIVVIALCFRNVGRARAAFGKNPAMERLAWAFGASLAVHLAAFMGSSYFDQMIVLWYSSIAFIATLTNVSNRSGTIKISERSRASSRRLVHVA
jgi:hypothetical protein